MYSVCICCLSSEDLHPLLEPDIGFGDILRDFFMIKMFVNESVVADILVCRPCARKLEEVKLFKEIMLQSLRTLELNRQVKSRRGKGGYLFVRKSIEDKHSFDCEQECETEILDEELLELDDGTTITQTNNDHYKEYGLFVKVEPDFDNIEHVIDTCEFTEIVEENSEIKFENNKINDSAYEDSERNEDNVSLNYIVMTDHSELIDTETDINEIIDSNEYIDCVIENENKTIIDTTDLGLEIPSAVESSLEISEKRIPFEDTERYSGNLTKEKRIMVRKKPRNKKVQAVFQDKHYEVDPDLKCQYCTKKLPNIKMFHVHMNNHHPNHICHICSKGYASLTQLKRHFKSHENGSYSCTICSKTFTNYNTMNSHRQRHGNDVYKCTVCEERFPTFNRRMLHLADVHGQTEKKYKCNICFMAFLISGNLSNHMRRVHLKPELHSCPKCGATFPQSHDLARHLAAHGGEKPHQCPLCSSRYTRKYALGVHMRSHGDDKRFVCNECGKRFLQKVTLQSHVKLHRKRT